MAPQRKVFSKSFDGSAVTLSTGKGKPRSFDITMLSGALREKLALHGLTQKLCDAAALPAGSTIEDKWEAIDATWAMLLNGEWSARREGAGTLLLRALMELYPAKGRDELRTFLDAKSPAERKALALNPKVRTIITRMEAERATDIDADELLDELEG
jgi:hypothetical protein